MKAREHAITLAAMMMVVGCQAPPSFSTNSPSQPTSMLRGEMRLTKQIIVKFKPHTIACEATQIAHLSAVTRVPLQHVRSLSGDACVIQQRADDTAGLSLGQDTLKHHPAIEWLEEDRMLEAS